MGSPYLCPVLAFYRVCESQQTPTRIIPDCDSDTSPSKTGSGPSEMLFLLVTNLDVSVSFGFCTMDRRLAAIPVAAPQGIVVGI